MSDMSPLQRLLLKAMRYASLGAAILLMGSWFWRFGKNPVLTSQRRTTVSWESWV